MIVARRSAVGAVVVLAVSGASSHLWAQLGARPADEWALVLESGRRMEGLEVEEVVSRIGLQPGQIVADIGAGTGLFSVPLARAVGSQGRVLSVEVDVGFLPLIRDKARKGGVTNIYPVLGEYEDPKLPRSDVDVVFFHDVLHHVADRARYLERVASYVQPGGQIVVVDYDMNVPGVPHSDQPEMLISPDQVDEWLRQAGFELTRKIEMFDNKFFVIYSKRG